LTSVKADAAQKALALADIRRASDAIGQKENQIMKRFLTVALISAIGLGAGPALAQQGQQQMPTMGYAMGQGMMGSGNMGMMGQMGMGPAMMADFGPMVEGRLAYMKAELAITDAQTATWDSYASAAKARATTMHGVRTAMLEAMQSGSAIERLDAHTKAMESMVESLKALRPATEALYKALSDDQKKKADLLLGVGCCMM
jgi:hypothetical protein